jgi:multiple sugar transport system ATP-binding protein
MTMGNRIVVMKDGIVQQVADPITLYDKPVNKFVAGFIGSPPMNFIVGRVLKINNKFFFTDENFRVRIVEDMYDKILHYEGKEIIFGIRPEDIYDKLFAIQASSDNTVKALIDVVEPLGAEVFLYITAGKSSFIARVSGNNRSEIGQDLDVVFDMANVHFFDKGTEETII